MTLPTPEQERRAIAACMIFVLLGGIGLFSLLWAAGKALFHLIAWVTA